MKAYSYDDVQSDAMFSRFASLDDGLSEQQ